ncbi:MAG TPA: alpha/beta hydrolase [Pyrinomonadaceae bacterium]|nr:alpha/beta hydrolase [Pyrinomonadaceae bacterium]
MNHLIYIALLLLLHGCAVSQTSSQTIQPSELRELARRSMMPVVYKVPGLDRVQIVKDVKYTPATDPNIAMDIYSPPGHATSEKLPAVIFIHGGARAEWAPKDWGIYTSWGRLIAASGFVAVTFTHRLEYPNRTLDAGARDVQAAINYVRSNADKYNVDKERICLIAFSAGGPMLSLALRGDTPYIKCVAGFYAFMDIRQSNYNKVEDAEKLKAFSPITYLEKDRPNLPAMFIARAGLDEVPTMNDSIDRFVNTAVSKNIKVTFENHPSGVHAFDNQNNDDRAREIIRSAIAFMRSNLKHEER